MKIIFLNIWAGKLHFSLSEFITSHSHDTDIFCFQEVHGDNLAMLIKLLPEHNHVFASKYMVPNESFAQATFIRKNISIVSQDVLYKDQGDKGLVLYTEISYKDKVLHLCNIHGVAHPEKEDNQARIAQSQGIIEFMKDKMGSKIVGGDMNVSPHTESVQMFLHNGYRELIKDYEIKTTRNHFAWDKHPGNELYYSDYVFVNPEVTIKRFLVPDIEVSDHLPIIVEII